MNERGFVWSPGPGGNPDNDLWHRTLRLLDEYRKANGHCNVPTYYESGGVKLGAWVSNQRTQYKLYMAGKRSQLTEERIAALNQRGFVWSVQGRQR